MKPCKHCGEVKPLTAFYKHAKMADGHINVCIPCRDKYVKSWCEANREKKKKIAREWQRENATPEKRAIAFKKWYDGTAQTGDGYASMVERASMRKKRVKQVTPSWAIQFFITEAYRLAKLRTKMTGIEWQVDHIVPLTSDIVCGLHTHDNLQVIPAFDNRSKKNYHWPDMPKSRRSRHGATFLP